MKLKKFIITLFFGMLGVHKCLEKKYFTAFIYLCTFGFIFFGWFIDTISALLDLLNIDKKIIRRFEKIFSILFGVIIILSGCSLYGTDNYALTIEVLIGLGLFFSFNKDYINKTNNQGQSLIEEDIINDNIQHKDNDNSSINEEEINKLKEKTKEEIYINKRKKEIEKNKKNDRKIEKEIYNKFCEKNYDKIIFPFSNIISYNDEYKNYFENTKIPFEEIFFRLYKKYNETFSLPKYIDLYDLIKKDLEIYLPLDVDENSIANTVMIIIDTFEKNDVSDYLYRLINCNFLIKHLNDGLLYQLYDLYENEEWNYTVQNIFVFYYYSIILIMLIDKVNIYNKLDNNKDLYRLITNSTKKYIDYKSTREEIYEIYKESFIGEIPEFDFLLIIYLLSESEKFKNEKKCLNFEIDGIVKSIIKENDDYIYSESLVNKEIFEIISSLCERYSENGIFIANITEILKHVLYYYTYEKGLNYLVGCSCKREMWLERFNSEIKHFHIISKTQKIVDNNFDEFDLCDNYKKRYKKLSDGNSFEIFLVDLFKELGYKTSQCGHSGDQGGDVILSKNNIKYIVQAKFYSSRLDNTPVQEVIGAKKYYSADKCLVITNNKFTNGAYELARINEVILIDGNKLEEIINLLNDKNIYNYIDIFEKE